MTATTTTRAVAKAAALTILRGGERPTAEKVRAVVGRGAQQTILGALDEFWAELGERVREPRLPAAVVDAAAALWSGALQEAARQWEGERADGAARIADLTATVAALRVERAAQEERLAAAEGDHRQLTARLTAETAALDATRAEAAELRQRVHALEAGAAALRTTLAAECAGREDDQVTWLKQIDEARQRLKAAEGALAKTQGALDQAREAEAAQRAELARATQRGADQERRLQEQVAAVAALSARGEGQVAQLQGLQVALATATREHDQVARAAAQANAECATLRARCADLEQERQTHLAQLAAGSTASAEAAQALRRELQDLLRPVLEQRHPPAADNPSPATPEEAHHALDQ
jgi:chromosome segregation ATPase